ncbi:MAG: dipeptide ABC transporter ATP-binding protein [Ilumatobacteraceae bacterium]|nr:dipeptide ABC transporter ATP-binding protein [Ilumatobacteraceae bacterium]MBJ7368102.1 dipeptide ABC transporter ATP-binding protein [Ilumatobacteraceae bacterium]
MSSDIALQAIDLVKHFSTGSSGVLGRATNIVQAVDGVSFTLPAGKTLGIVGESGCGKSTLARLVTRLIEPSSGSVFLDGVDITTLSGKALREMRRKLQMIFQDPYSSLNPRHSIGQIIGDPMRIQGVVTKANEKAEVQELMQQVGLNPEHYNRYPHEFSGGQRQRIGIARALSLRPSVIVADEPVSALDVSIQAQILNLLENLQKDLGLSFVFIAHDLSVVRHIADQVAVMYLGKIVEVGDSATVYNSPAHPYTKALLSAVPVANPALRNSDKRIRLVGDVPSAIDPPSGCRFRTRCWKATDLCEAVEPSLQADPSGRVVACHFPEEAPVSVG